MHRLTIYRNYFTNSDCFKAAKTQTTKGVQVHSTGANNAYLHRYVAPDDGRLGTNKYNNDHNRPGGNVCASAYIGKLQDGTAAVYQTLPWNYRCWLSGSGTIGNANTKGYIGFEICEDGMNDEAYFREVIDLAALLTAHLCSDVIGKQPDEAAPCGMTVMDHRELHNAGYASNHGDIRHWASIYGYTMDDFRNTVKRYMEEGVEVTYIDAVSSSVSDETPITENPSTETKTAESVVKTVNITLKQLTSGSNSDQVKAVQRLLNGSGFDCGSVDGKYGKNTTAAVIAFQQAKGLTADGICGVNTWKALLGA